MRSGDDTAGLHHPEGRGQRLLRGLLDLREGEEARTNLPRDGQLLFKFFSLSFFFLVGAFFLSDKDFVCV